MTKSMLQYLKLEEFGENLLILCGMITMLVWKWKQMYTNSVFQARFSRVD